MIYRYDKQSIQYKNITLSILLGLVVVIIVTMGITISILVKNSDDVRLISQETKMIIINESLKEKAFSPAKLKSYILELNIRFPHIIYAQARLESGNFNSKIFKTNNNLFGMKVAKKRPTTNKGEENGHAYYETWQESVVDYAFYQAQYLNDIKTESDYFVYLKQNYAEDTNYVDRLKRIINEEKGK
jgi:hypothetical protein